MDSEIFLSSIALVNVCISWLMVGLIWIIQIVTYPIFTSVSAYKYDKFHSRHVSLITPLVAFLMLFELIVAVVLVLVSGPYWNYGYSSVNLGFLAIIWTSTFLVQIPLHAKLSVRFEKKDHTRLVKTNWIRTFAWTIKGLLSTILIFSLLQNT